MSLRELMDEDRRLCILRCLSEAEGRSLNEDLLLRFVGFYRLGAMSAADLRGFLTWLEGQRLVRIEKLDAPSGLLWVATLTADGLAVTQGKRWPGVAEPSAR